MILFKDKYERAKKWQLEQKEKRDSGKLDMGYEVSPEDLMEKGDMLAMMISGVLTILPIVFLILLIIALAGMAFLHIL
ncbi:MAG: hypothetical protein IKQ98_02895 [Erysipelotrichaceae bacterium]|nr:hypothetical protein [Erysipelotrichaceae bacterium]